MKIFLYLENFLIVVFEKLNLVYGADFHFPEDLIIHQRPSDYKSTMLPNHHKYALSFCLSELIILCQFEFEFHFKIDYK